MLTRDEAERLAQAINALRPDWPVSSLVAFLGKNKGRPMRDLALELTFVALDSDTKTPARINADGPWKKLSLVVGDTSGSAWIAPPAPSDCEICGRPPIWRHIDHVYQPRDSTGHGTHKPPELDELIADTRQQLTASTKEPS